MKVQKECFECLKRLISQACSLATDDLKLRLKAEHEALAVLEEMFSTGVSPPYISSRFHRVIRTVTGNTDPYRVRKSQEIEVARKFWPEIEKGYGGDFYSLVQLSALGNAVDFFKQPDSILVDARRRPSFAVDDVKMVEEKLKSSVKKALFLADNAGESFFDRPLVTRIREQCDLTYVVKGGPAQNDMTIEDLRKAGLEEAMGRVMTTGTDTVGLDFTAVSQQFKKEFEEADLVVAKGMGYYETLHDLQTKEKVFYLMKAKCRPVAQSLGVPLGSYVAMLQR